MAATPRRDRRGEWWVDFRFRGRRVRRPSPAQTRRGAEEYERALRLELLDEEGKKPKPTDPLFGEYLDRWLGDYVYVRARPSGRRDKELAIKNHLRPAFGALRLSEITAGRVAVFTAEKVRARLKPKTVNNLLSVLRCSLTVAVDWGLATTCPKIRWLPRAKQHTEFFTPEETARLIAATRPGFWRTFVVFLLNTGCRFGEAAALRWDDMVLDGPNPRVHIRRGTNRGFINPPKADSDREIPLNASIAEALRAFRHERPYVFERRDGGLLRPEASAKYLRTFCERAGVRYRSWHKFRHTFGTELAARGVPLGNVQTLLGHTTIAMTMRYVHPVTTTLRSAVEMLPGSGNIACDEHEWSPNGHQATEAA
jgi:integrase